MDHAQRAQSKLSPALWTRTSSCSTLLRIASTHAMVLSAGDAQENDAAQHAGPQGGCNFFVDNDRLFTVAVGDHEVSQRRLSTERSRRRVRG